MNYLLVEVNTSIKQNGKVVILGRGNKWANFQVGGSFVNLRKLNIKIGRKRKDREKNR